MTDAQDVRRYFVFDHSLWDELPPLLEGNVAIREVVPFADYDTLLTKHRAMEADYAAVVEAVRPFETTVPECVSTEAWKHLRQILSQPHPGAALQPLLDAVKRLPKVEAGREIRVNKVPSGVNPETKELEFVWCVEADIDDENGTWDLGTFDTKDEADALVALLRAAGDGK